MRRDYARTIGCAALLFALNACIALHLFTTEYTRQMGSIEAAYIGLARWLSQHWNDLGWFPLWYGGIPYPDTYPPLLHWICGLVVTLAGVSPGLAHHFVTAVFYSLGPVTLFWMAWRLCGDRVCALVAAIGYSLISPSCLLVNSIRLDSDGIMGPRRLITLVAWGEGPHVTSMCLFPLAIGMVHVALEKRRPWYWVAAALSIAAVPMSNWLGGMALAIAIAAYLFAGFPGEQRTVPTLLRLGALGVFAYAMVMPWLSPSTIAVIRANAPRVATNFQSNPTHRLFAAAVVAAYLLAAWAMARWKVPRHMRFALLASLVTATTALARYWFKLSLLPQPERYHLEMDMFLWLAVVFLVWPLVRMIPRREALALAAVLAITCVPAVKKQRRLARYMEAPVEIQTTIEYKTAKWLDAHLSGARVFAPGTIGFWLNAFSDAQELTGGFDNGILNPMVPHVIFNVYFGDDQQAMLDLLRAYGCDAIVGGGKDSAEVYHPFTHPEKFRGLTELWRDGGDAVYDVPRRSRGLAHVMRRSDLVQYPPAPYGLAVLQPYLAGLENPEYPPAAMQWRAPSAASVTADLRPDQILSVQISWDKGWNASVGGRPVAAFGDKLGQMVVEPHCSGRCTVELNYDGGAEGRWARVISRVAWGGGAIWILATIIMSRKKIGPQMNTDEHR